MPSNFFEDLYNDTSGTDVTTRAATGCGAPTLVAGGGTVLTAAFGGRQTAFFGDDAIRFLRYPCTPPSSGDYELQCDWEVDGPAGGNWRLEGRIRRSGGGALYFMLHNNGTAQISQEASGASNTGSHTLGTGVLNSMRFVGNGATVSLYVGATKVAEVTTATVLAAGDIEIGGRSVYINRVTGVDPLGSAGPVITGPSGAAGDATSTKSVAENTTAVHTFTADVAVTWSKNGGADAARFNIDSSTGALTFAAAPDFENPTDADTNNQYVVVVRATATSGGATADQTVTVTVTNATEVPLAPTIGTATPGNASASVAFTPPNNTGRPAITGYTATSSPGGFTGTGASSPITVSGLSNGTAYTFTVTATNADGTGPASAASNSVTPSAPGTAPSITSHPSNQTVTAGATATFSVSATGSGTLTYQWQRNGSDISGATSSSYTTPSTTVSGGSANNGDLFRCVVTGDTAPPATSNAATLTVNAAGGISGTFTLPGAADRADKQEVTLHSIQALTALTVNGNGATVNGAPASLAANGFFRLRFDAQSVAWYRVG